MNKGKKGLQSNVTPSCKQGENMLSFLVFADLHYKKGMYAVRVQDLKQIMKRAHENNVDFVLHAGDFCNDYSGFPRGLYRWDIRK